MFVGVEARGGRHLALGGGTANAIRVMEGKV